jgi:hypothetical protein
MMDRLRSVEVTKTNGRHSAAAGEAALTSEALRQIVLRHRVCYEVWPEWSANGGRAIRIGFALSLCGVHDHSAANQAVPGCPDCWQTYGKLRVVAEWITPEQERACRFEIAAFDRAWHVAPNTRQARNETVVTIRIFHRRNVHAPIDDCQQQCLKQMRQNLAELGIRENVWAGVSA